VSPIFVRLDPEKFDKPNSVIPDSGTGNHLSYPDIAIGIKRSTLEYIA